MCTISIYHETLQQLVIQLAYTFGVLYVSGVTVIRVFLENVCPNHVFLVIYILLKIYH